MKVLELESLLNRITPIISDMEAELIWPEEAKRFIGNAVSALDEDDTLSKQLIELLTSTQDAETDERRLDLLNYVEEVVNQEFEEL
ncbi:hypothetical protein [Vibrio coralliirubri]|uniref:hypothetical protein n=1 Tax=Vibrio coralliirubri TaxID=1516159 RepID=UPI000A3B7F0E|nr:hypothetical protein [Vibrio coralliirubri]